MKVDALAYIKGTDSIMFKNYEGDSVAFTIETIKRINLLGLLKKLLRENKNG